MNREHITRICCLISIPAASSTRTLQCRQIPPDILPELCFVMHVGHVTEYRTVVDDDGRWRLIVPCSWIPRLSFTHVLDSQWHYIFEREVDSVSTIGHKEYGNWTCYLRSNDLLHILELTTCAISSRLTSHAYKNKFVLRIISVYPISIPIDQHGLLKSCCFQSFNTHHSCIGRMRYTWWSLFLFKCYMWSISIGMSNNLFLWVSVIYICLRIAWCYCSYKHGQTLENLTN